VLQTSKKKQEQEKKFEAFFFFEKGISTCHQRRLLPLLLHRIYTAALLHPPA
jgi:hypothetical protein